MYHRAYARWGGTCGLLLKTLVEVERQTSPGDYHPVIPRNIAPENCLGISTGLRRQAARLFERAQVRHDVGYLGLVKRIAEPGRHDIRESVNYDSARINDRLLNVVSVHSI